MAYLILFVCLDEMSMVSPLRLYQLDQRLRVAIPEKANVPFGGLSLVLMGDNAQLPPVCDKALYEEVEPNSFGAQGKMAYSLFKDAIVLDTIMRQRGLYFTFFFLHYIFRLGNLVCR